MKKVFILISFVLITGNLYANQSWDETVVKRFMDISHLLNYQTRNADEGIDSLKYANRAISWMKDNKMNMNSSLAAEANLNLGMVLLNHGDKKEAKEYVVKANKTFKNVLGENNTRTKEIKMILRDFF